MTTSATYHAVETAIGGRYATRLSPRLVGVLLVFCSLALTAGGSGGAATTSSTSSSKLPLVDWNCYTTGRVKPTRIVLACGDGNGVAENLTWLKWSNKVAIGKGDLNQNDCTPDCAEGTFHTYPARFLLSETVPTAGREYFTKVTITFAGKSPLGRRVEIAKDCFDNPPTTYIPRCPPDLQGAG
jgi:hypothetical protein